MEDSGVEPPDAFPQNAPVEISFCANLTLVWPPSSMDVFVTVLLGLKGQTSPLAPVGMHLLVCDHVFLQSGAFGKCKRALWAHVPAHIHVLAAHVSSTLRYT